jgi:hypothetical protein
VLTAPVLWPSAHTSAVGTSMISRSDGSYQQHNLVHFVQVQQIKLKFCSHCTKVFVCVFCATNTTKGGMTYILSPRPKTIQKPLGQINKPQANPSPINVPWDILQTTDHWHASQQSKQPPIESGFRKNHRITIERCHIDLHQRNAPLGTTPT